MQHYQTQTFGQAEAQGNIMPEPPSVLSAKDQLYITDAMSWLLTAVKKCHHFAQECNDPDVKQALDKTGRMHQMHYQVLLQHLQPMQQQQLLQQFAQRQQQQYQMGLQGQQAQPYAQNAQQYQPGHMQGSGQYFTS